MAGKIFATVVGALLVAGIYAVIRSRWLYVISPKLYLNTPISDGQVVTLEIFNAGLQSEEDVAIIFRKAFKFELIATSKSTLIEKGNVLSLSKVSRFETVKIVLLVEGKAFESHDIECIESKNTQGKVVEKKEQATALWQSFAAIPLFLLVLGFPFLFGTYVGAEMGVSGVQFANDNLEVFGGSKEISGFQVTSSEYYATNGMKGVWGSGKIKISVEEVVRRGDILKIAVVANNNTDGPLIIEGNMDSPSGRGSLDFFDSSTGSFGVSSGGDARKILKVFLPEDSAVPLIESTYRIKNSKGDSLTVRQMIDFGG